MTRDGTLAHDLFALPFPVLKINTNGFPPGFLHHQAAHTELPTLSGICHRLRCKKSKVSCGSCFGFLTSSWERVKY